MLFHYTARYKWYSDEGTRDVLRHTQGVSFCWFLLYISTAAN